MSNLLVQPLVTLLLLCYVCVVCVTAANNLTVGYLANIYGYHGKNRQGHIISGAMTYAVQQVNDQHVLPENYTLEFIFEDTKGETLQGTNAVINMWRKGVVSFFGPENSCEVEATVSASLNLPMISYHSKLFKDLLHTYAKSSLVVSFSSSVGETLQIKRRRNSDCFQQCLPTCSKEKQTLMTLTRNMNPFCMVQGRDNYFKGYFSLLEKQGRA